MDEKIAEIIDPNFKNGIGKNNKPWYMMKIVTDTGKPVNVFGPANVGDEVTLTYNEQYKNYSGQVKQNSHRVHPSEASNDLMKGLGRIYVMVEENNKLLKQLLTLDEPTQSGYLPQLGEKSVDIKQPLRDWTSLGKPKETEPLPEFPGSDWIGE